MFLKTTLLISVIMISWVIQALDQTPILLSPISTINFHVYSKKELDFIQKTIPAQLNVHDQFLKLQGHSVNYSAYMDEKQKEDFLKWKAINADSPYDLTPSKGLHIDRQEHFLNQMTKINTQLNNSNNTLPFPIPIKFHGKTYQGEFSIPIFRSN